MQQIGDCGVDCGNLGFQLLDAGFGLAFKERQRAYQAYVARGANAGKTDNRAIAAETLALREERARLLGYDNFAAFKLETEMAQNPANVRELLMQVWKPARAAAEADAAILAQMLHSDGFEGPLEPWDWHFYSNLRRQKLHDLDEAELKPYLQLDRMAEGSQIFGRSMAKSVVLIRRARRIPDSRQPAQRYHQVHR
ncbi:MAG TPA: hypothetical protein DD979_18795 [Gammaproteobacteria bacterium]|nr:hypothetical protein [Gammaproteobacteria bacterium]